MLSKFWFLFLISWLALPTCEAAKRRFNIEIKDISCYRFGSTVKRLECRFKKIALSHFIANFEFELERELSRNAEGRILVTFQLGNSAKIMTFLDLKSNICDFSSQIMTVPLIKRVWSETRRTSNLPYACPLKGNHPYYMANYSIKDDLFPTYTPYIKFNFSVSYIESGKLFASSNIEGSVVPK